MILKFIFIERSGDLVIARDRVIGKTTESVFHHGGTETRRKPSEPAIADSGLSMIGFDHGDHQITRDHPMLLLCRQRTTSGVQALHQCFEAGMSADRGKVRVIFHPLLVTEALEESLLQAVDGLVD